MFYTVNPHVCLGTLHSCWSNLYQFIECVYLLNPHAWKMCQ
jgi:hypothetical protein